VVKEAMVFGAPVIANDLPGIRLIDPEGRAIQYVTPGDLTGFVRCMADLASDPAHRAELRRKSQSVVTQFSHERVAAQLAVTYHELLEEPEPRE
jgi:glycosyltransferase involved in cell wall biosynthesis